MKRVFLCLLCLVILLSGCSNAPAYEKPVSFYYCVSEPAYSSNSSTIQSETRDTAQMGDLEQILRIYLAGPESEELRSPFPAEVQLVGLRQNETTVFITLSEELAALTGLDLTMACGCIALTCLDLTGAENVTIDAGEALLNGQKSITMDKNTLLLQDNAAEGE